MSSSLVPPPIPDELLPWAGALGFIVGQLVALIGPEPTRALVLQLTNAEEFWSAFHLASLATPAQASAAEAHVLASIREAIDSLRPPALTLVPDPPSK